MNKATVIDNLGEEPAEQHLTAFLRDPTTNLLDACRIADLFDISLADVLSATSISLTSLRETPAALSVQNGLTLLERVAFALLTLAGSRENARIWLNMPEPQFDNQTPLAVLIAGRGQIVAEMLEDVLFGQPS